MHVFSMILILFIISVSTFVTTSAAPAGTIDIRDSDNNEIEPLLNQEIYIVTWVANNYYSGRIFDVEFTVKLMDTDKIVLHNIQQLKLNFDEAKEVREKFIPIQSGKYYVEVKYDQVYTTTEFFIEYDIKPQTEYSQSDSNLFKMSLSPLKQLHSGILPDQIECKLDFVLIQKYDDSPACVKPETKIKLLQRGWSLPIFFGSSGEETK